MRAYPFYQISSVILIVSVFLFAANSRADMREKFQVGKRFYNLETHETDFIVYVDEHEIATAKMADSSPTWHDERDTEWRVEFYDLIARGKVEYGDNRRGFVPDSIQAMITQLKSAQTSSNTDAPQIAEAQAIVQSPEQAKKFNLLKTLRPGIPEIKVKDGNGEDKPAWQIVSEFAYDGVEESINLNESYSNDSELREIEDQILRNLLRSEGGSVKLLAPAGVGKSMLIKRIMARAANGDLPKDLQKYRFMTMSSASLTAGTKYSGTAQARTNAMAVLSKNLPIVWIVDEAHTLAGSGKTEGNSSNLLQSLKPDLASGSIKMIGLSTPEEWGAAFADDPALDRRFGRVNITEPHGEKLSRIMQSWLKRFNHEQMTVDQLTEIERLSDEFSAEGAQPSRSTMLLAEIFADRKLKDVAGPVTEAQITEAAKRLYGIDPSELEPSKRKERYSKLESELNNLAGQERAKSSIKDVARRVLVGMQDRSKPRYRIVFAGPKGQGKTEIVKLFSKAMGLPVDNRILMSNFTSPMQVGEMKNEIATFLRRNSFTVLFFDEIEKAHPAIQKALLSILDAGEMTMEVGSGVSARPRTFRLHNASVFMATNAGQSYIDSLKNPKDFDENALRAQMEKDGLDEYLLDRSEAVAPFFFLNRKEFSEVLKIHIEKAVRDIRVSTHKSIEISNIDQMIENLNKKYFKNRMSNRDALRIVAETVRSTVTDLLFKNFEQDRLSLKWQDGKLTEVKLVLGSPPSARSSVLQFCKAAF